MIKIETHCHTRNSSRCASAFPNSLIEEYKEKGYGGAVLTNHLCYNYFSAYEGKTERQKIEFYISLIRQFEKACKENDFRCFYGAEILVKTPDNAYREFILVGFNKSFLRANKPLFYYTQEELFEIAEKHGFYLYQTHPQRGTIVFGNPKYMHGAESFNGHVNHQNNNAKAKEYIVEKGLKMMSGTDYHDAYQPITGGIYIPENIKTNKQLAKYLRENQPKLIEEVELYEKFLRK